MVNRSTPRLNLFGANSDWITYHTVVSTAGNQIAIAPGYLQREWQQDGRHYYEYSMGSTHTQNFYAYISAKYATRKEAYSGPNGPVSLEVYYDPAHTFDIDDMLASSRAGLDYYQAHFSPYQFTQYRIFEFPRYRGFAQSFPNTIPYSEGIGFISRMQKKDDIDLTYFVTAHELGPSMVGASISWRAGAGFQHDVRDAGAVLRVHGDAAEVRQRLHAQSPSPLP